MLIRVAAFSVRFDWSLNLVCGLCGVCLCGALNKHTGNLWELIALTVHRKSQGSSQLCSISRVHWRKSFNPAFSQSTAEYFCLTSPSHFLSITTPVKPLCSPVPPKNVTGTSKSLLKIHEQWDCNPAENPGKPKESVPLARDTDLLLEVVPRESEVKMPRCVFFAEVTHATKMPPSESGGMLSAYKIFAGLKGTWKVEQILLDMSSLESSAPWCLVPPETTPPPYTASCDALYKAACWWRQFNMWKPKEPARWMPLCDGMWWKKRACSKVPKNTSVALSGGSFCSS